MNSKKSNDRFLNEIQRILCEYEGKVIELKFLELAPACDSGDNYMSEIMKITAFLKSNSEKRHMILKKQLSNKTRRKLFRCDLAFTNEILAYNFVIPELEKHLNVKIFPKVIYAGSSMTNRDEDWIVLEDLSVEGFKMMDKVKGINFDQTIAVMRLLGKFHSASISMRVRTPKAYNRIKSDYLNEILFDGTKSNADVFDKALNTAINVLKSNNHFTTKSLKLLQRLKNGNLYKLMMNHITDTRTDYEVISHGDTWTNNLMFKSCFNDEFEVKLIDLQTLRCCSPVIDLLHLMYSSVPFELRTVHLDEFLMEYHESFIHHLTHNLKGEYDEECQKFKKLFTFENMKDEYLSKKTFGLGISLWLLPMITFKTIPDMNVDTFNEVAVSDDNLSPKYQKRLLQILHEFC